MGNVICQKRLNFLSGEQKAKLNELFGKYKPGRTTMPHQLAVQVGITYSEALTILAVLDADGLWKNKLLIYHKCEPDVPADAIPYGQGFPDLPWHCPLCEEDVEDYDDLLFDVMADASEAIEFI